MSIIAISGKIGSGKDLTGSIIKELSPYNNWEVKKFAGKLKEICSLILNFPVEYFEVPDFKQRELGSEWDYTKKEDVKTEGNLSYKKAMTVRDLLQLLGTNAFRDQVHPNIWVNALFSDYTQDSNWIITDCRFINEAEAIKKRGGVIVRIEREEESVRHDHSSESELDTWEFDYVIKNDSDIETLKEKVGKMLDDLDI